MINTISKPRRVSKDVKLEAPVRLIGTVTVRERCTIGQFSFVNDMTTLFPGTTIGRYCSIGKFVQIGAPSHPIEHLTTSPVGYDLLTIFPGTQLPFKKSDYVGYQDTTIGSDVWIGTNSIILAGVTIGHGAVVGGLSLVNKDLEPYGIYGGTPVKLLRYRFDDDTRRRLLATKWWERSAEDVAKMDFTDIETSLSRLENH